MDLQQKLRDFSLLLKTDRKVQIISGVVVVLVAWALLAPSHAPVRRAMPQPQKKEARSDSVIL